MTVSPATTASQGPGNGAPGDRRPVSSLQGDRDEQIFGAAFDGGVIGRFVVFLRPYRRRLAAAIAAV